MIIFSNICKYVKQQNANIFFFRESLFAFPKLDVKWVLVTNLKITSFEAVKNDANF